MGNREEKLSYMAGIVDGEGCISCSFSNGEIPHINTYGIYLRIGMTSSIPLEPFIEEFGGKIKLSKRRTKTGKNVFFWAIYCRNAVKVLNILIPYLRLKKDQAKDAIIMANLHYKKGGVGNGNGGGWKNNTITPEDNINRRAVFERMRERTK